MNNTQEPRPLPEPPWCRGIPLGDGNYSGCAYGYGDIRPLLGPCDCPICEGSGFENVRATFLPHSVFGDPECCGFLCAILTGDQADITCNECEIVLRTVLAAELKRVFDEMELKLDTASEICPHCESVNLFPGFSRMSIYTCKRCGEPVKKVPEP